MLSDEAIFLSDPKTRKKHPGPLRPIRARWQVELLLKELKQTLPLRDFYGENTNAVVWQIWPALLVHLLLRFLAFCSK